MILISIFNIFNILNFLSFKKYKIFIFQILKTIYKIKIFLRELLISIYPKITINDFLIIFPKFNQISYFFKKHFLDSHDFLNSL